MKSTFKILLKLLFLVILLLISPLYSILESHVKSMDVTGYFALERVPKLYCQNKREWSIFHSENFGDVMKVK